MTRNNALYLAIGVLLVVSVVLGYELYREREKKDSFEFRIGDHGISVEKK